MMRRHLACPVLAACFFLAALPVFAQNADLPRLAVVEFSVNVNTPKANTDAVTVRNITESQMIGTGKYDVITRNEIDKLLANQQIAVSSISSDENVRKLQLQNISYIVTGSVDAMGNDYAVTVKILDVSTGKFSHSANDFMGGSSRELYTGVNTLISRFVSGMASQDGQVVQTEQNGPSGSGLYKIGDRGPGGGFIFYAENGGYMECSVNLGNYSWSEAKTVAKNYRGGNLTDWYLPSKEELNMIYSNLKTKKLGGLFVEGYYWSSSEYNANLAYEQNFGDGGRYNNYKGTVHCVRAVRAF